MNQPKSWFDRLKNEDIEMHLSVEEAIKELQAGKMIIAVDDEDRENEGDIICAAETITPEQVNFIVKNAKGMLCVALESKRAEQLNLNLMTSANTALHNTNFTITVDAIHNTSSGISASDRSTTIRELANPNATQDSFARPGHINPIIAKDGGVLRRSGHTEAVVDFMKLAGFQAVGVLCEILDADGSMARMPSLEQFAKEHNIGIVTIENLIRYRNKTEQLIDKVLVTRMPTNHGYFELNLFVNKIDKNEHLALVKGDISTPEPVLVRVHDQCMTGDVLGAKRCDCGNRLQYAMDKIEKEGRGVLLYMAQPGRGTGLLNQLRAYALLDEGHDEDTANKKSGIQPDEREYGIGAQILASLGIHKMRLMTNNPKKIQHLNAFGLEIVESIPFETER